MAISDDSPAGEDPADRDDRENEERPSEWEPVPGPDEESSEPGPGSTESGSDAESSPNTDSGPDDALDTAGGPGVDTGGRSAAEVVEGDESGTLDAAEEEVDAIEDRETPEAVTPGGPDAPPWYLAYLRDHAVHIAVVVLFAGYPFLREFLTGVAPPEMTTLLPSMNLMVVILAFGLFAMSFDFISGYTGYLSFGHAAFFGVGGYFVVLAANGKVPLVPADTPFVLLLVLAGLAAVVAAVLIGAVSFRLTGVYFAMITLGFAQVLYVLFRNWDYVASNPRTGPSVNGSEGFQIGIPGVDSLSLAIGRLTGDDLALAGVELSTTEVSYFAVGLVVMLCYFAMQRIVHSPFGRVMIAIRENEERARAVGYNTFNYKMAAFAISGFFGAVAGGLMAGYRRTASPDEFFYFLATGDALLAAIIGGFGTLAGALFGWLLFESLDAFLSSDQTGGVPDGLLPYLEEKLGENLLSTPIYDDVTLDTVLEVLINGRAELYIGIVFVLFVLYVPNGILGTIRQWIGGTIGKRVPQMVSGRFGQGEDGGSGE